MEVKSFDFRADYTERPTSDLTPDLVIKCDKGNADGVGELLAFRGWFANGSSTPSRKGQNSLWETSTSNHQMVNIGEFNLKKKYQNFKFLEEKLYLKKDVWTMANNNLVINPQIF